MPQLFLEVFVVGEEGFGFQVFPVQKVTLDFELVLEFVFGVEAFVYFFAQG